ncbi:unnamed protein product [Cylindrotheca closterium]|uniref:Uncharacterized protein n=1 Tax=Cylindrotheca closterium TaxID=2856 RepID=A0AAD2FP08_9STRA|nr:unnamed protein product [Cylindrotheca closterium]
MALGPEGLHSRDFTELMVAAVDVPALPGKWKGSPSGHQLEETVLSRLDASQEWGRSAEIGWGLDKAKTSAFGNMSLYIEAFMAKRNYLDDKIDDYCNQGAVVRLVYKTYGYYNQLLGKLRELHYKHFQRWEGSPAAALLDHHSEKLLFIRCNSVNRTAHLLRSYTYLRDAAADGFSANEVIESLWERVSEIHQEIESTDTNDGSQSGGGKSRTTTTNDWERSCPKCGSKKLHNILQKGHTASACPLSEHSTSKAHKMRTKILRVHTKDKSKDVNQIIKDVSETWDTPQEGED